MKFVTKHPPMSIWSFVEDLLLFRIFRKIFRGDARQADNGISTAAYCCFEPHHLNQTRDRMDYLMSESEEFDELAIDELEDKIAELEDKMLEDGVSPRRYERMEEELERLQERLDEIEDHSDIYGFHHDDSFMDDFGHDDLHFHDDFDDDDFRDW